MFCLPRLRTGVPKSPKEPPKIIKTAGGVEMVLIPEGRLSMGSKRGDPDEAPIHNVWVDSFLIDRHEVTQEEYTKFVIGNPSRFKDPKHPVEQVRWLEAAFYCNARSLSEDLEPCYDEETGACNPRASGYRLPSEAEWEYACRAGTETEYSFGGGGRTLKTYAWYKENANKRTQPVGQKKPNPAGLYDMHGNVAEWCNDKYDEDYYKHSPERNPRGPADGEKYALRGGAWNSSAVGCRSAYRSGESPGSFADSCFARPDIGFRCVRNLEQESETGADAKET
ncbi:MAG: formylglycine-generating enzyme family protein [Planctomycetes bacterium]|nr:formylglycine-generating enzyme family protein [Planctomycetota bacterium]